MNNEHHVMGDTAYIKINRYKGKPIVITLDAADLSKLSDVRRVVCGDWRGYPVAVLRDGKKLTLTRLLMPEVGSKQVTRMSGDKYDLRQSNLKTAVDKGVCQTNLDENPI